MNLKKRRWEGGRESKPLWLSHRPRTNRENGLDWDNKSLMSSCRFAMKDGDEEHRILGVASFWRRSLYMPA